MAGRLGVSPTLLIVGVMAIAAGAAAGLLGIVGAPPSLPAFASSRSVVVDLLLLVPAIAFFGVMATTLPAPAGASAGVEHLFGTRSHGSAGAALKASLRVATSRLGSDWA